MERYTHKFGPGCTWKCFLNDIFSKIWGKIFSNTVLKEKLIVDGTWLWFQQGSFHSFFKLSQFFLLFQSCVKCSILLVCLGENSIIHLIILYLFYLFYCWNNSTIHQIASRKKKSALLLLIAGQKSYESLSIVSSFLLGSRFPEFLLAVKLQSHSLQEI